MKLTMEIANDKDAVWEVLSNPRQVELDIYRIVGFTPEQALAGIFANPVFSDPDDQIPDLQDGQARVVERWLTRIDGTPVAVVSIAAMRKQLPELLLSGFEYSIYATPEVDRYPVAYTKCARGFVLNAVRDYASSRHIVTTLPGSKPHKWLRAIGFRDTPLRFEKAGATVQLMEHVNSCVTPEILTYANGNARNPNDHVGSRSDGLDQQRTAGTGTAEHASASS